MIVLNLLAIVLCGGLGGVAGFGLIRMLDLTGIVGALVAAVVGMAIATLAWAAGATLLRALGLTR
jgi:hypothetical protein